MTKVRLSEIVDGMDFQSDEMTSYLHRPTGRVLWVTGAFRRFKDTVHRLGLADAWYASRERGYSDVARNWCEANDIPLDSSPSDA